MKHNKEVEENIVPALPFVLLGVALVGIVLYVLYANHDIKPWDGYIELYKYLTNWV